MSACCTKKQTNNDRAGIIIIKDAKILVIKRIKNGQEYYCIPGGHLEDNETAQEAAIREITQETTLSHIVLKKEPIFTFENQGRNETYFVAQSWSGVPTLSGEEKERTCSNNSYELIWADLEEIKQSTFYPNKLLVDIIDKSLLQNI